jgi:hypothetical protein
MRLTVIALSALLLGATAPALAQEYAGTWALEHASEAGYVQLEMRYQHTTPTGNDEWDESRAVPWSDLHGVSSADLDSGGVTKSFSIVHDAGTFEAQGSLSRGHGGGTWTFQPSASFNGQLNRRGIGSADTRQQFELAMSDFTFATLDQLLASGFARPSVADLVSMVEHGVSDRYIQEMRGLGLRPNSAQSLIRMRDHGVGSAFATAVMKALPGTSVDKLIALRDHGVGTSYMQEISQLGLRVSADDLIRLRDHGVTSSFIERMRSHGYTRLSVDDLIRLRDSGF